MSLCHTQRYHNTRDESQHCDHASGSRKSKQVSNCTGDQRAQGISEVPPEPINADCRRTPGRLRDVSNGREQRRINHRSADPEEHGPDRKGSIAPKRGNDCDGGCLDPHAGRNKPFPSDPVGECAGHQLRDTPHTGIKACEYADLAETETRSRKNQWKESPGKAVIEIVHEPSLGCRREIAISEGGSTKDFAVGESF